MQKEFSIAAVIVTFNRKDLLAQNIRMLLSQDKYIDCMIIVDNHSTDGTKESIHDQFKSEWQRFDYNYLSTNTGGAGGFEYGVRRAYELGYDLIWLMDDDGRPINNSTLSKLTEKIEYSFLAGKPFILNSLVLCGEETLTFGLAGSTDRIKVEMAAIKNIIHDKKTAQINPFNGTLLSKELVGKIGYPNGQFVIYGDETEYAERAVKAGAYVATVVDSLYYHPSNSNYKIFFGKKIDVLKNAKWRYYYSCRNKVYCLKLKSRYQSCYKLFFKMAIGILLADDKRFSSFYYACRGFCDGMRGRLGAVVGPPAEKNQ